MERETVVDQRRRSFFVVDNVVILEYAEKIGSNALALYVILACHTGAETGECYPSIKRLMKLMDRSRTVVFESIEVLKAHGLLSAQQRRMADGGLTSNLYTLLALPDSPVPMAAEVRNGLDEGGTDGLRGSGCAGDDTRPQNERSPVRIVDREQDVVLNQTYLNQTNLKRSAPEALEAQAPIPPRGRVGRPSEVETAEFFKASGSTGVEAGRFWNFYESKGWLVGRAPMRDWRAAARNWMMRKREEVVRSGSAAADSGRSSLAEMSERNEARLEEMRARGVLRPRV